jgi:sigma-B regulation protein RsbU (phosphoserine phosphatase)
MTAITSTAPNTLEPTSVRTRPVVLVVDDDNLILKALERTLKDPHFDLVLAKNGQEALKLMRQQSFAVIICDQTMPGLSGAEVLREAINLQSHAIRILLTGSGDLNTVVQAINVGQASQFILKPWDEAALRQTVSSCVEKHLLLKENERLQQLTALQHAELAKSHDNLTRDLKLGARIHEVMLMGKVPENIHGLTIAADTVPSREIDGDFYDFFRPLPQLFDVVIGDVMGKGIPAALVGTAVKTQLTRFAVPFNRLQVFDKHGIWHDDVFAPQEIITKVQQEVAPALIDLEYFASLFYGRFDLKQTTFTYIDCGSSKPLHYRASLQRAEELSGDNFPIGVLPSETITAQLTRFEKGDLFVFYSDGVTEARSPSGELFGVARLRVLVEENHKQPPAQLLAMIKRAVVSFAQKAQFDDDLTIIIVHVDSTSVPEFSKQALAKFSSDLSQMRAVRDFVQRLCLQAPGDNERLNDELQLAINEAFCNIVVHGHKRARGEIILRGELGEEGIVLELSDQGTVFDPSSVSDPSFAGDRDNGFGWYIVKEIADRVIYARKESEKGWNHLKIFKKYHLEEGKMDISHDTKDGVLVVTLEGEHLDARETPFFKQKVVDLLENERVSRAVFDLHRLQFIDSSGLGAFLSILKALHSKGGDLKLSGMNRTIRTMFELVCMHKIFEIFNSPDEALRSFQTTKQ